ncbi:hypothetical protein J5N97_009936 [Dioscorea zingiberensis]|uniref:Uncharacterized protein n=1 Tax=Dioscorea zingiberensis TaxID=325984 RepID=A0A9D5CXU1_9LILI|nr:hypothetical protein J5N97_009936 [Dioscorea zingiberensis]
MKTMMVMASGSSSATSSSTLTRTPSSTSSLAASRGQLETSPEPNSCYFPGCRKDTNCKCDICLASINATLDLVPNSSHSAVTKLSSSSAPRRPLFTPVKTTPATLKPITTTLSPPIQSTAKSMPVKVRHVAKKKTDVGTKVLVVLMVLALVLLVDYGVPKMVAWNGFQPKLRAETVSKGLVGELRERIRLVQQRIEDVVDEKVFDCSSHSSGWEFHQEGQNFFHWRCVIYKSWIEEVSIWGSPLQTSGLFPAAFSPRSLSVISGRITEWSERKVMGTMRTSNSSSWKVKQWSKSVLQLDANTWVLEYQRSAWLEGQGLLQTAWEMMRFKNWKLLLVQQTSPFSVHRQDSQETRFPT